MAVVNVLLTDSAKQVLRDLSKGRHSDPARAKKVLKTMRLLETDPSHPGLATHRYEMYDARFGEKIWESYVEHRTPSAWRIWWHYGPGNDEITIVDLGPHP